MKNKTLLITCLALASSAFSFSAHANTVDIQDVHGAINPASYQALEEVGDASHDALQAVKAFASKKLESTGELPSSEEVQDYLLAQESVPSHEEVEEALDMISEQTSLGSRIPVSTSRIIALVLLGVSYNYPQVWPVTLMFLLDADSVLPHWIYSYFENGFAKVGLTGLYYGIVIQQFEQFQGEFKKFLSKYGNNIHEYWMPITGTTFAFYKYIQRQGII